MERASAGVRCTGESLRLNKRCRRAEAGVLFPLALLALDDDLGKRIRKGVFAVEEEEDDAAGSISK